MKMHNALILQVKSLLGLQSLTLQVDGSLSFTPGQYLAANLAGDTLAVLPEILFIEKIAGHEVTICPGRLDGWHPGMQVNIRGPLGSGVRLPPLSRRLVLIALDDHPARLLSLAAYGSEKGLDMVMAGDWVADTKISGDIAPSIELALLSQIQELTSWADFILFDVPHFQLQSLGKLTQSITALLRPGFAQVLIHTPMPCVGIAECGICAVRTRRGYKHACQDGPVFDFQEISFL